MKWLHSAPPPPLAPAATSTPGAKPQCEWAYYACSRAGQRTSYRAAKSSVPSPALGRCKAFSVHPNRRPTGSHSFRATGSASISSRPGGVRISQTTDDRGDYCGMVWILVRLRDLGTSAVGVLSTACGLVVGLTGSVVF